MISIEWRKSKLQNWDVLSNIEWMIETTYLELADCVWLHQSKLIVIDDAVLNWTKIKVIELNWIELKTENLQKWN